MRWFTSDIHFWHRNVIKYSGRPWSTVEEMNQGIIDNFNALVKPEDLVYCLGDFSLSYQGAEMRKYLNGTWMLVPGNHDKCHQVFHKNREEKKANSTKRYEDMGFIVLPEKYSTVLTDNGEEIAAQICHFPYQEDQGNFEYTPRYQNLRPKPTFLTQVHLNGHVHNAWKTSMFWFEEEERFVPQINLGVDVWDWKPVSEAELFQFAKSEIARAEEMTRMRKGLIKVDLGPDASKNYKKDLFED